MIRKAVAVLVCIAVFTCNLLVYGFTPQIDINNGEKMYNFYETFIRVTERNYRFGVTKEQLLEAAIRELLKEHPELFDELAKGAYSILDENSRYLSVEEYEPAVEKISGEFEGIGINVIDLDGMTMVGSAIKGTPAYLAGIMTGDIIVSVDDTDVRGFVLDQTIALIRGERGTYVKLGIERGGKLLFFDVMRDVIKINPIDYHVLEQQKNAAYVRISTFNANTASYLEEALRDLAGKGVEKIILDLRYNLGGLLTEAVKAASYFLPDNTLVVTEDFKDPERNQSYYSMPTDIKFKAVVLVNEYSASASEIVAAAIKENNAGVLVGVRTFGKGTVQQNIHMKNGGAMWLTIAKYLTPGGSYIHDVGIEPDYPINNKKHLIDTTQFEPIKAERVLTSGDKGKDVLAIEQRLEAMGYPIENADEAYDNYTAVAVTAFQSNNGLYPYGVADITTQIKIMDVAAETEVTEDRQLEKAISLIEQI